jgi:hypothetical protein
MADDETKTTEVEAPPAPLTLADKIRKLGTDREVDAAVIEVLLEIDRKLERALLR